MSTRRYKRVLALLLTIMMTGSLLIEASGVIYAAQEIDVAENSATGVKYNDVAVALNAATDGQTIKVLADIALSGAIVYDRSGINVTFDLNGYRLVRTVYSAPGETEQAGAVYVSNGQLTIKDTSINGNGYIEYENIAGQSGSGLNIGANGSVKLQSGGILGTGQSIFAHEAGGRFEMSGGVVYGSGDHVGSEGIAAASGAYITISGGYLGTRNVGAAMIWSGATLDPTYWSMTGGYFTSRLYSDGATREIANFVTQGEVADLIPPRTHATSGTTEYNYHLTVPRTITFDASGGNSATTSQMTDAFGKLTSLPAAAVKSGVVFKGWYTAAVGGIAVTTGYVFDRDTIVYAQYEGLDIYYIGEQLTGLKPGTEYGVRRATGVDDEIFVTTDVNGHVPIGQPWFGGAWSFRENDGVAPAVDIDIPLRPVSPVGVTVAGVSAANVANGKLYGLTGMEIRLKGTGDWTSIEGDAATGLRAGTYEVRKQATWTAFASEAVEVEIGVLPAPELAAEGDGENNLVNLSWTSSLAGQEYYMVYQRELGGNGLDEFQSIPLKTDIKVLNVYPDIAGSDGLKDWMSVYGNPGEYKMQVDKVSISDFNSADTSKNYSHYLSKDAQGAYLYDVLYFGAWDANNRRDLTSAARDAVEAFIQYGGGVLVGHDTASFDHANFIELAQKYLNMDVVFQENQPNPSFPPLGSTQVAIQRRGFPMNYPYALGNVGDVLTTPMSHSYYQFAKGDVWFKYSDSVWGGGNEVNTHNGQSGTNNFYLTTWNNAALVQTGHSNGTAYEDEQKILANTLFYLAQTSTANSFKDRMSQDVAAPDAVSGHVAVSSGSAVGKLRIEWNAAMDNGSSYAYYMKAISYTDGSSRNSTEATATVTTGIKGYAVVVDTNAAGTDPGNTATTIINSFEADQLQAGSTYYAHIKAIDRAGNASSLYTVPFTIDADGLTPSSIDPRGKANDGKTRVSVPEVIGQGNKLVYLNAGSGNVSAPGVGEALSGYAELPANGLIPANDGDMIGVAELDADGRVVRFGRTVAKMVIAPVELAVSSVDPAGAENNGKTAMIAGAGVGNSLVFVNFRNDEPTEPGQGQLLTGYAALPSNGIIGAERGDNIAIAEIDSDGKVVRFGVARAKVSDESEARGLTAAATDPTGAGMDGRTKVSAQADAGNTLAYVNFKQEPASIPAAGSQLHGQGYSELPASGLIDADHGDLLGIAEVDPFGNVVRYVTVPAVVSPESGAKGLTVGSKDAAGAVQEGKTQITGSAGAGNTLVYLNYGEGPATPPLVGQPAGNGYANVPASGVVDARNGDFLGVAEIDEHGNVVRFGTTRAIVTSESAAKGLPIVATDAAGAGTDGLTKLVSKAAEGNKLVYVNFGEMPVMVPGVGETITGYTDLPESGHVAALPGDRIGVAELGPDGRVVKYGMIEAVVVPESAAKPLAALSVVPSGAGVDGKTQMRTSVGTVIGSGNKLVYLNAGQQAIDVPKTGAMLTGYTELPSDGQIEAVEGDTIALAEVDAGGKVVRFGTAKANVANSTAAQGLTAAMTDPSGAGTEGKTKLADGIEAGEGNKLVYLNFGRDGVVKPAAGDTLTGYENLPADRLIDAANGDRIGIAEIDAAGRVVKFGWADAIVYADTAASGLQATSVDPTGVGNDGNTSIQAMAATGNTLVYVNFGKQLVLVPNTGELLTGYADLPADGIVPATHGDRIAVAELDGAGRIVRFGIVNAIVVDSVNEYYGGGNVGIPNKDSQDVEVLVNGKIEYAGKASLTSDNGRSVTTIDVDQEKLQAKLEAEGSGAVITVPWLKPSDVVIGQLNGRMIQEMEDRQATLVLDIPTGSYRIPTSQLHIATLAKQFGDHVALGDVQLQIRIAAADPSQRQAAEHASETYGVKMMATPVTFTVHAVYNERSIEITDYSVYVERRVVLPDGVDPNKITTGVVFEPDGTLRHVPTKVTKANEMYYAQINSLTNSDYGVIWNPVTFDDMTGHWSEVSVNNMGSRLVVNGVGEGRFNPDAYITRAEFAAIVVRGLGLRLDSGAVPFTDVSGSEWYASVVNTAVKFGLIAGYEDGSFRPRNRITRQEAMVIMARAMKITGLKDSLQEKQHNALTLANFRDTQDVAIWAREGAELSVAGTIIRGRTADMLRPKAFITRAETATIVQRLLQQSNLI